jgi:hypothetical protein
MLFYLCLCISRLPCVYMSVYVPVCKAPNVTTSTTRHLALTLLQVRSLLLFRYQVRTKLDHGRIGPYFTRMR